LNEKTPGREPIILVQIDQDFCNNQYGVAPCTADGPDKCFNTAKSCQDFVNYDRGSLTLTFAEPRANLPRNLNIIPSLRGVNTAPSVINPANGNRSTAPLGQRALASISFEDHPHSDLLVDPYRDERVYDPLTKSTFWAKWLARNPYYQNRPIRIYEGYVGQELEDMRVRHYIMDAISGPNDSGSVKVTAKDPLNLADRQKSQVPKASLGRLNAAIDATQTTIQIKEAELSDYDATGTIRMGDELCTYTGRSLVGDLVQLTGLVRGADGSIPEAHRVDASVQKCVRYVNQTSADVIYDLLTTYAGITPDLIDKDAWDDETAEWLQGFNITGLLSKPEGVATVLNEILEQALAYIWWDERDQQIKFRAIRALPNAGRINDDSNILRGSVSIKEEPRERASQIWLFWNQRNQALPLDNETNYDNLRIRADLEVESADKYGESRIRKIYARWIQSDAQAINLAVRLLDVTKDNPRTLKIRLDAKDRSFWTADVLQVQHRNMVDVFGNPSTERYQILSAEEIEPGETVEYMLQSFPLRVARVGFYTEADALNYDQYTEDEIEEQKLSFYSDEDGLMPDGTPGWEYQ
jgi:hypothetical protein